jgi:hypothetical protein
VTSKCSLGSPWRLARGVAGAIVSGCSLAVTVEWFDDELLGDCGPALTGAVVSAAAWPAGGEEAKIGAPSETLRPGCGGGDSQGCSEDMLSGVMVWGGRVDQWFGCLEGKRETRVLGQLCIKRL